MPSQITIVLAALVLAVAACGPGVTPGTDTTTEAAVTTSTPVESGTADREDLLVVATTSILGDVVANVLGDAGRVEVLMPIGTDAHDFQPSAQQVALIGEADLVVANGLGLEEGLVGVLEAAQAEGGNVLELADLLDPIPFAEEHDDHAEEETEHDDEEGDHGHGDEDPHFWFDPVRVAEAARIVAHRLAELDEGGSADQWDERAEAYAAEILAIDDQIRALLDPILNRRLVTNHDVLGYFADRYDFEVIGVVIPGGSTLAEPSAQELAELVEEIEEEGVSVIVAETSNPSALAEAVAAEVGREVQVVTLFTESLGEPGSGADTYLGMMLENARRLAAALG